MALENIARNESGINTKTEAPRSFGLGTASLTEIRGLHSAAATDLPKLGFERSTQNGTGKQQLAQVDEGPIKIDEKVRIMQEKERDKWEQVGKQVLGDDFVLEPKVRN